MTKHFLLWEIKVVAFEEVHGYGATVSDRDLITGLVRIKESPFISPYGRDDS
jgi:hypothetical protein